MLAYAESSPSSYLLNHLSESRMNSYRSAIDDLDFNKSSYARSPSFDSGTLTRRYGSTGPSIPIGTASVRPAQYSSSGSYDTTSKYSSSYDSSTIGRRSSGKPPLPYYSNFSSSKYSSASNSPDVRSTNYRYDRAVSSDRNPGGESYRSAVSHISRMDDDFRRLTPSSQVNHLARKFENLSAFDHRDGHARSSTRTRDRSYDYSYPISNGVGSYSKYGTMSGGGVGGGRTVPYDEESRDTIAALPQAALYRSRIGALSVPDVPSYAKNQVRHELEDDDDDDEDDYLERRTVGYGTSTTSTSNQRKITPANTPTSGGSSGFGSSASSSPASFSRAEPIRLSNSSVESSESRRSNNDNLVVRNVRSSGDDPPSTRAGLLGLRNLGNTCFMNSVIQCLSHTRLLREYCLQSSTVSSDINNSSRMKGALMKAFCETLSDLWASSIKSVHVNPDKFKQQIQKFAPRFTGYNQQDAQEFLRYLLQGLHEDINRSQTKLPPLPPIDDTLPDQQKACESWKRYLRIDDSKIVDLFVGQLKSELKCTHCGNCSTTFDPFWDLSLPIPQEHRRGQVSLNDCMDTFAKEEILDGDEKPTCDSCKTRRRCTKKFFIQKFPTILVLHLKRFSGERYRSRLSTLVDFPTTKFDLSPYASSKNGSSTTPKYDLFAVSNHSGTPMMGHYTAYCKHSGTGGWYLFDDTRVTAVNESTVVSSEAYVLFYELTSTCTRL